MATSINIFKPSVCFEVQKVIGISTNNGSCKTYQVQWSPSWISGVHLIGCEDLIEEFERKEQEKGYDIACRSKDDNGSEEYVRRNTIHPEFQGLHANALYTHNVGSSRDDHQTLTYQSDTPRSDSNETSAQPDINPVTATSMVTKTTGHGHKQASRLPKTIEYLNERCAARDMVAPTKSNKQNTVDNDMSDIVEVKVELPNISMPLKKKNSVKNEAGGSVNANTKAMKIHKCKICNKTFSNASSLSSHSKLHGIHKCFICHRVFTNKNNLQKHQLLHTGKTEFPCNLCKEHFTDDTKLQEHLQKHTEEEGTLKCLQCSKIFVTNTQLRRHAIVHTEERPFICKVCHKGFKLKYHVKRHEIGCMHRNNKL